MILIIDDDIAVRASLLLLLNDGGFDALACAGPAEAMKMIRKCKMTMMWQKMRVMTKIWLRVKTTLTKTRKKKLTLEELVRRLRNTSAQPAVFVFYAEASPKLILEALALTLLAYLLPLAVLILGTVMYLPCS